MKEITEERFWAKVDKTGECWVWTAYRDRGGYGTMQLGAVTRKAHRVSYEMANRPIPAGLHVLHRCDTATGGGCAFVLRNQGAAAVVTAVGLLAVSAAVFDYFRFKMDGR